MQTLILFFFFIVVKYFTANKTLKRKRMDYCYTGFEIIVRDYT